VTDDARLQRIAGVFAEGGWAPTVAGGGFTHEFSAPSAGPPPWYVYKFTPDDAYALAQEFAFFAGRGCCEKKSRIRSAALMSCVGSPRSSSSKLPGQL
jgi:hypothetical protein